MNPEDFSAQVTLNVTTTEDQNDGSAANGLSLRDAILIAQRDPGKEYIINLPEGTYNLTIEGNEDFRFQEVSGEGNLGQFDRFVARSGDLDVETRITIIGSNPDNTVIDASLLGDRIFDVKQNGFLNLKNITIQNGSTTGTFTEENNDPIDPDSFLGGGIRIAIGGGGKIENSVIQNNRTIWDGITDEANVDGAGIANRGQLEIINSTILGNISDVNGGGIYNEGRLEITGSSIVNNSANVRVYYVDRTEGGGGILNTNTGTVLIRNSTISGNKTILSGNENEIFANGAGGGGILSNGQKVTIINSTIVNNTAPLGAGILIAQPDEGEGGGAIPALLQNSIVALNENVIGSNNTFTGDIDGFFDLNSSYNLIGNGNGILFDGVKNNIVGTAFNPIDPLISPLQFNGGSTPTHALLNNSPAINQGSNAIASQRSLNIAPLSIDQTGKTRIIDGRVDIGSFEYQQGQDISSQITNSDLPDPLYRFQNTKNPGTYIFVGQQERQSILNNYPQFQEEGFAFGVSFTAKDNLTAFYRFQNTQIAGTYLYVNEQERQSIIQNYSNTFIEEGLAFYAYGADSNQGQDIYRFQNLDRPSTYIFVGEQERQNILANHSNFREEGVAFEI
ncbi:hypothetical protein H6G11_09370 [Cyanobacterium aponinum FACHB-4101]|uniref:choice-of-anchor Q domain-containing protein n=1 Tax=Cyanobacterium aponinum TaxID=379064 RepID=UPI00168134C9|nr:choice-of-anchor Q domain-containing protein [Cyanobacterium aponinum]MBD2394462.1 hypothetical protein [Cyanobacterium aponinum FACHB-4101]